MWNGVVEIEWRLEALMRARGDVSAGKEARRAHTNADTVEGGRSEGELTWGGQLDARG